MARYGLIHERFEDIVDKLSDAEPPCMSQAEDWETCKAAALMKATGNCTIPELTAPDPGAPFTDLVPCRG